MAWAEASAGSRPASVPPTAPGSAPTATPDSVSASAPASAPPPIVPRGGESAPVPSVSIPAAHGGRSGLGRSRACCGRGRSDARRRWCGGHGASVPRRTRPPWRRRWRPPRALYGLFEPVRSAARAARRLLGQRGPQRIPRRIPQRRPQWEAKWGLEQHVRAVPGAGAWPYDHLPVLWPRWPPCSRAALVRGARQVCGGVRLPVPGVSRCEPWERLGRA